MKLLPSSLGLLLLSLQVVFAQSPSLVLDTNTVGYWRFDELSGSIAHDASPYHNDGATVGAAIVPGRFGNALGFNGTEFSYVEIPYPGNGSLDFGESQSFTVEAWFNTVSYALGQTIVRKGLAPVPGFAVNVDSGRVGAIIGNRSDGTPPDTLLLVWSDQRYNDGQWHYVALIRDREVNKIFLYIDGVLATSPIDDPFPYPLVSNVALDIGSWAVHWFPAHYNGMIDEVRITHGALHQRALGIPEIYATPSPLNFGVVPVGMQMDSTITIANLGWRDSLRVSLSSITNARFTSAFDSANAGPYGTAAMTISYTPGSAIVDTGSMALTTNDPLHAIVHVPLVGRGYSPGVAPVISSIRDIPNDIGKQVRVVWYRSVYDGVNDSLSAVQYGVWRRVDEGGSPARKQAGSTQQMVSREGFRYALLGDVLWDFICSVPAVRLAQYAVVAPTLYDSAGNGIHWSVFRVSAQLSNDSVAFSDPDSGYSVSNIDPSLSVRDGALVPERYSLEQNYPNPFNPSTTIRFALPRRSHVSLGIFNVLGQEVAMLEDRDEEAGYYETRFDASRMASGVYFYRIQIHPLDFAGERGSGSGTGDFVATRKLVLVR